MKKIPIAVTLFLTTGACLLALSNSASRGKSELRANQTDWQTQTQQLAEIKSQVALLKSKISDQRWELQGSIATTVNDPELANLLLTNGVRFASPELQSRMLAAFGKISSQDYLLVSKAALANSFIKPLKPFPDYARLTDKVCGVLAITDDEQQSVEAAVAGSFNTVGTWAKENVQREGPAGDLLVQYTIPADDTFYEDLTHKLFSSINSTIGIQRGELLHSFFDHYRLIEAGAVGNYTNILSIYRIKESPGYAFRSGWRWSDGSGSISETINTHPEPIKPDNFPLSFRCVFPGGWKALAEREGFELPKEFNSH